MFESETATPSRSHYKAIVISPHLDDAVFSCGGTIAQLTAAHGVGSVLVVNLFTDYGEGAQVRGVVLGDQRRHEERAAARLLGFESICLDERDAWVRRAEYQSLSKLFGGVAAEDRLFLPQLRQRLMGLFRRTTCDLLLTPLGVGWHVDHQLTRDALAECAHAQHWQYEDVPYAFLPHVTRLRLNEIAPIATESLDASLVPPRHSSLARWQTVAAYNETAMMQNVKPAMLRWLATPVVAAFLYRLLSSHEAPPAAAHSLRWHSAVETIEPVLQQKLDAMQLYASQFRELFVSRQACEASHRRAGLAVERRWRLQ